MKEMGDDFNAPKVVAGVFDMIRNDNPLIDSGVLSSDMASKIISILERINNIFGIIPSEVPVIPDDVQRMITEREGFRHNKKFDEADKLREQIKNLGYEVEDTAYGPLIKKYNQ